MPLVSGRGSVTRRTLGRSAFLTAAAVATGGFLGAAPAARAQGTGGKIKLILQVSWQGGANYAGTVQHLTEQFLRDSWLRAHPGVELATEAGDGSNGSSVSAPSTVAAVLAGQGPDILVACCGDELQYVEAGLVTPLDPFLRRDNVNVNTLFPASLLSDMSTTEYLYGLPDYGSTMPLYINLSLLDQLGLRYPQADWTHDDAARLWRSLAGMRNKQWMYGAILPTSWPTQQASSQYLVHGWGGHVRDASRTRCLLDSPECVAAYEWLAPLAADKVIYPGLWPLGGPSSTIPGGQTAFAPACCGTLQYMAVYVGDRIKWDVIPVPSFPAANTSFIGNGVYMMNALSKNPPDLVWDLFKFVTTTLTWQRFFNAKLAFMPPPMLPAEGWADWIDIVHTVAPVLRNKHLEYFRQSLFNSYDWAYFKYQPFTANGIWANYENLMFTGKMSVVEAVQQITRQINAVEAAGAVEASRLSAELRGVRQELARAGHSAAPVTFAPPPVTGQGNPSKKAAAGDVVVAAGKYTLAGTGQMADKSDAGTFACAAGLSSRATYSCRLVSIAPTGNKVLQGGTKIGLMARADLSDNAAMVWIGVDGTNGVHIDSRAFFGGGQVHVRSGEGLPASGGLVASSKKPLANWLLKPLWLKWERSDATWTAYTSTDGSKWTKAGTPISGLPIAGAWVGLFVDNKNSPHPVKAVFDNVTGFAPGTFVVLGG